MPERVCWFKSSPQQELEVGRLEKRSSSPASSPKKPKKGASSWGDCHAYLIRRAKRLTRDESGKYKPTFYVRYRDDLGKVHEESTGETSRVRAKLWAKRNFAASRLAGADQTFGAYAANWWTAECDYCEGRIARGASITMGYRKVRRYYQDKHILPQFKDTKLSKLSTRMIEAWVMALRKTSLSPTTVNQVLKTLKIMTGEAMRLGYLASDPAKSVRQLKETPEVRGILTLEEIRALFDEKKIGKIWDGNFRHFALNITAASCGLRLGEVLGLTVQYVHPDYLEIIQAWGRADG